MSFTVEQRIPRALGRAGALETPHGPVFTPAFAAVGTKGTVKALTPAELQEIGVPIVLANAYHLYLEPGAEIVKKAGGLGAFMGWPGPTMTDSGGFQVFSLGAAFGRKASKFATNERPRERNTPAETSMRNEEPAAARAVLDEDGVTFRSPKDGREHRFIPERSIEIQHALGADIIFAFDECAPPDAPREYQREACERTHRWAARSFAAHARAKRASERQMLFGIVQGGRFEDLRRESARQIGALDFDGFGIGGTFEKKDIDAVVGAVNRLLPEEKPRHLLGIGEPADLFGAVENGCDLFDCVGPTRQARNGSFYTGRGRINIGNAAYKSDFAPLEEGCGCYACRPRDEGGAGVTRAYLAHLFRSQEILANTLGSIHNLYFIVHLVKRMRQAILDGTFQRFKKDFLGAYRL